MKYDEFREYYLSQPTDQLLFLKDRGELIEAAMAALDSVLIERNVSVSELSEGKIMESQGQANIDHNKNSISKLIKTEVLLGIFYLSI